MIAYLTNYSSMTSLVAITETIEVLNSCNNPFSLVASPASNPPDYLYTGNTPALTFVTPPFVVEPSVCTVTYSCTILSGPRDDICSIIEGSTVADFESIDGSYSFDSIDMASFPAGTYTMQITGTVGSSSDTLTIDLVLVDPCPSVALNLQSSPFQDNVYVLRDPQHEQVYVKSDLISPDTQVDCGATVIEFFIDDASKSTLDVAVFEDGTTTDSVFKVLYNEDILKRGSYAIKYRVYQAGYASNFVESDFPFVITLINPCENPNTILPSTLVD